MWISISLVQDFEVVSPTITITPRAPPFFSFILFCLLYTYSLYFAIYFSGRMYSAIDGVLETKFLGKKLLVNFEG